MIDLLRHQPWTARRRWLWPKENRAALIERFNPRQPAYFVESFAGAWAQVLTFDDAPAKNGDLCRRLVDRGFRITGTGEGHLPDHSLDTLSLLLAYNYPIFERFLAELRFALRDGRSAFSFKAGQMGNEGIFVLRQMCFLLRRNHVFSSYDINTKGTITGNIAGTHEARHFVTGTWLERCVKEIVQDFLNLQPARIGCMQNVCGVRPDGKTFEADTFLMVDEDIYMIESKSGDYHKDDIERYATIGKMLALPENRIFVVAGNTAHAGGPEEILREHGVQLISPSELFELVEMLESVHLKSGSTDTASQT